uniref:Ovule protein n=1 Tax=Steinernema glaseri TaxID=37863 RepID=A0A1I7XZ87_9BILA
MCLVVIMCLHINVSRIYLWIAVYTAFLFYFAALYHHFLHRSSLKIMTLLLAIYGFHGGSETGSEGPVEKCIHKTSLSFTVLFHYHNAIRYSLAGYIFLLVHNCVAIVIP